MKYSIPVIDSAKWLRSAGIAALCTFGAAACSSATKASPINDMAAAEAQAEQIAQSAPVAIEDESAAQTAQGAVAELVDPVAPQPASAPLYTIEGMFTQGGLAFGQTTPGTKVVLDGHTVFVGGDGRFVFGFGRDHATSSTLVVTAPDGRSETKVFEIADREFRIQRIDGLPQSKVSGYTPEQLKKIRADQAKKKSARANTQKEAAWASGFDWPVRGRISGVFGSQRILNGEAKRPHSGLDVAAPTGTPIVAPADGIITLAETDMYFEGGLILMDHGHWLESAFLHLSRVDVTPGQAVKQGDVIGAVGSTGRSTGPHLHWSIKWQGRLVDPQLLMGEQ